MLSSTHNGDRILGMQAIITLDPEKASGSILGLLETDPDERVILLAGKALSEVATAEDLDRLDPLLERKDRPDLQYSSANALSWWAVRNRTPENPERIRIRVLPVLRQILESPRGKPIRRAGIFTILERFHRIYGKSLHVDLRAEMENYSSIEKNPAVRGQMAKILKKMK